MLRSLGQATYSVVLLLAATLDDTSAASIDGAVAIKLFSDASQAIRSFDVHCNATERFFFKNEYEGGSVRSRKLVLARRIKLETPTVRQISYRQVFQKGQGRIEIQSEAEEKPNTIIVYNGEVEKTFEPQQFTGNIRPPAPYVVDQGSDYLESYRNVFGRETILEILRQRHNCKRLTVTEVDTSLLVLHADLCPLGGKSADLAQWGFKIGLDTRRGLLPAWIETYKEVGAKHMVFRKTTVNQWHDVGGVAVPMKITTHRFDEFPDAGTFGQLLYEVELTVDPEVSSWNKEIMPEVFQLPLAAGVRMTDSFRGVTFLTGKADPGTNLADLAGNAKNQVPITLANRPAQARFWSTKVFVSLGVFLVSLVVIALLYFRRRAMRTGGP